MTLTQHPHFNLTPKQRAFANHWIETGSAPEAAMRAYNCSSRNSARVIAHRNRNNPKIQAYMQDQLLTQEMVDKGIRKLHELTHATKLFNTPDGPIEVSDNSARLKAIELYFKLLLEVSQNTPEMPEEEEQEEDSYWAERYEWESGRKPTPEELRKYRETVEVVSEEEQIRLFSTKKKLVSFKPSTFVD